MRAIVFIGLLVGISGIPSVVMVLGSISSVSPVEQEAELSSPRSYVSETVSNSNPEDSTKVAIIALQLQGMTIKDHVVTENKLVYVLVSPEIFAKLPKFINGLKVKRYTGPTFPDRNDVSYLYFSGWVQKDDSVWLTSTAYFAGGNVGGCDEQYDRSKNGKWTRVKSDCFAMAS